MKSQRNPRIWQIISTLALAAALALSSVAVATEHQHQATDSNGNMHQHHADTAQPKPSAMSGHVHAMDATVPGVGLDEQLGSKLPLDLTFHDEEGRPVRLADLVTRPTVIALVYYRCPNVCHFLQGELAQVLPQVKLVAGQDYEVLSISFDENETPELARRTRDTYLSAAGGQIPASGWRFLTGDLSAIQSLTQAAGFHFQRVGEEFQHPVVLLVISRDGTIIRYLHGTSILPKDLTLALYEAKEGHIGTTIRKMVQYCFSYDPEQKTYVFNVLRVSATVILATLGAFLAFLLLTGKKKPKDRNS